jgi:hypothetical protein
MFAIGISLFAFSLLILEPFPFHLKTNSNSVFSQVATYIFVVKIGGTDILSVPVLLPLIIIFYLPSSFCFYPRSRYPNNTHIFTLLHPLFIPFIP